MSAAPGLARCRRPAPRQRQRQRERRATAGALADDERPAHGLRELRGDREAEADAVAHAARHERAQDRGAVLLGDARARIAHDTCPTPAPTRTSTVTSPPAGVACSAFVTRFVTICRMRSPSPSTTGCAVAPTCRSTRRAASLLALRAGRALAHGDEVDLLDVERERARLEAGEVEQVADQPLQAPGLGEHDLERRLLLVLAVDHAVRDRLHVPLDRRQRRAQLVRDAHQEVALVLARLLQLARHLLEAQRQLAELVRALRASDARRSRRARCARWPRSARAPGA